MDCLFQEKKHVSAWGLWTGVILYSGPCGFVFPQSVIRPLRTVKTWSTMPVEKEIYLLFYVYFCIYYFAYIYIIIQLMSLLGYIGLTVGFSNMLILKKSVVFDSTSFFVVHEWRCRSKVNYIWALYRGIDEAVLTRSPARSPLTPLEATEHFLQRHLTQTHASTFSYTLRRSRCPKGRNRCGEGVSNEELII